MGIRLEREALYSAIWDKPLRAVATDYGLSDTGLRKVCVALNVPMPPRGYWAKKAAGHAVVMPPLPGTDGATSFVSRAPVSNPDHEFHSADDDRWFAERIAFDVSQRSLLVVSERPERWHPVIAKVRDQMVGQEEKLLASRAASERLARMSESRRRSQIDFSGMLWDRAERRGQLVVASHRPFPVRASIGHFRRALVLLNAVASLAEARGLQVSYDTEAGRIVLDARPGKVELRIAERLETTMRVEREGRPRREIENVAPTGQLRVFVEACLGSIREISDRMHKSGGRGLALRLENRVPEILQLIYRQVVRSRRRQRENDAMHARWEAQRVREQMEERRRTEERLRRERLLADVKAWQHAEAIRTYVRTTASALGPSGADQSEWATWALAFADELDPIRSKRP